MMHVGIPAGQLKRLTWSQYASYWEAKSPSTIYHVFRHQGAWTVFDSHGAAWGFYASAHQAMNAVDLLNQ